MSFGRWFCSSMSRPFRTTRDHRLATSNTDDSESTLFWTTTVMFCALTTCMMDGVLRVGRERNIEIEKPTQKCGRAVFVDVTVVKRFAQQTKSRILQHRQNGSSTNTSWIASHSSVYNAHFSLAQRFECASTSSKWNVVALPVTRLFLLRSTCGFSAHGPIACNLLVYRNGSVRIPDTKHWHRIHSCVKNVWGEEYGFKQTVWKWANFRIFERCFIASKNKHPGHEVWRFAPVLWRQHQYRSELWESILNVSFVPPTKKKKRLEIFDLVLNDKIIHIYMTIYWSYKSTIYTNGSQAFCSHAPLCDSHKRKIQRFCSKIKKYFFCITTIDNVRK